MVDLNHNIFLAVFGSEIFLHFFIILLLINSSEEMNIMMIFHLQNILAISIL